MITSSSIPSSVSENKSVSVRMMFVEGEGDVQGLVRCDDLAIVSLCGKETSSGPPLMFSSIESQKQCLAGVGCKL